MKSALREGLRRADTLALRLFLLIWVALVLSHVAAFIAVHTFASQGPPTWGGSPPPELGPHGRTDGPPRGGPPSGRPPPGGLPVGSPPLPTFPSLPPTPGLGAPAGAPPAPGGLPPAALALDYGVRLFIIGLAAWWGSRWLARPVERMVSAAQALGPALASGREPQVLDEHNGTREVRASAAVFNRMAAQIRQLFRARGLMIAAISHDLRTPLTRMRLRTETAGLADDQRARFARDLQEMNALIDTVLEVFRAAEGRAEPLQRTDVAALIQALLDDRAEHGAEVALLGGTAVIATEPLALRRVLGNLIDNALRYAGHVEVQLAANTPAGLRIQVLDRGPGIPPDQLDKVLEPFMRVEGSRAPATGGTGLGLFIAHELVRRLGGSLTLSARPEGGLCAEVRLPPG